MLLRVVTNPVAESGNFRVEEWDLVPNGYTAIPANDEYTFTLVDLPENFPMNYNTYVVSAEGALVRLTEEFDDKIIDPGDWDDSFDPMLTRIHDIFV